MDYYEVLNLKKGASESDIKKAYYKLARENHPDKVDADKREEATKNFQKIGEAYEVLSDAEKRGIYDQFGKDGLQQNQQNGQQGNPFNMFSQMFGQNFGFGGFNQQQRKERNRKNKPTVFPLNITLTDVYKGIEKKLKVTRKVISKGGVEKEKVDVKDYESTWKECDKCKGQGVINEMRQMNANMFTQVQKSCEKCSGKGFDLLSGYEITDISEIISVICEKGVTNGNQILFPNLGNAIPGYLPGDLVVVVQYPNEEKGFARENDGRENRNLIYRKEIRLVDALCGISFNLETLDGRNIVIKHDEVITPHEKKIIYKEGIVGGNLIIIFDILFPEKIKNKEKLRKLF